jgi:hypothetical protein
LHRRPDNDRTTEDDEQPALARRHAERP